MKIMSDRIESCTTAAELKSNVARCLHSRTRHPAAFRPLIRLYTVSISVRLFCRYFLFSATRAVAGRSPANLITSLCSRTIVLARHVGSANLYFRNEHIAPACRPRIDNAASLHILACTGISRARMCMPHIFHRERRL